MKLCGVSHVMFMMLWVILSTAALVAGQYTCEGYNDGDTEWPTNAELTDFGDTIQGDVYLPGSSQIRNAGKMIYLEFNSEFGAVVYPETTDDVKKAVLFAKEHGIRPTVLSTGHDFNGRSSGDKTFSINLSRMKEMNVVAFEKTLTTGTGNSWIEIYEEVDDHNLIAVGGSAHTVSPGGYTLGGGHSPVVRKLGLAVDNVLDFTIVTADGSIVYVSENGGSIEKPDGSTEPLEDGGDLWWAVLGGGGGVYGIVTRIKYRLHDPPADGFIRFSGMVSVRWDALCRGVAEEVLRRFFRLLRTDLSNEWGGYLIISKPNLDDPFLGQYGGNIAFFMNHWGGNMTQAKIDLESITDYRPECHVFTDFVKYDTFLDYERTANDPLYYRGFIVNTLIQEADIEEDSDLAELLTLINNVGWNNAGCTGTLLGGAGNNAPHEAKSVTPDLRTGFMSLSCGSAWDERTPDDVVPGIITEYANGNWYKYGTGAYYNEPDYFLDNWKTEFWKTDARYNRLLRVKQQWDPDNLFWCHHCVGSDLVTYESDTKCRTRFSGGNSLSPTLATVIMFAFVSIKQIL